MRVRFLDDLDAQPVLYHAVWLTAFTIGFAINRTISYINLRKRLLAWQLRRSRGPPGTSMEILRP
jgi:hypothetical protein